MTDHQSAADSAAPTKMPPGRRQRLLGLATTVAVAVTVGLLHSGPAEGAGATGPTPYQRQLRAQTQEPAGNPRTGADPGRQRQGSLAAAASRRQGTGPRSDHPATGVRTGSVVRQPPPAGTPGVTSGGCVLGYGVPGAQCLPARGPGDTPLTCTYVVTLFPAGVRVAGTDRLRLDTDRDGVGCGPGDAGVPPPAGRRPSALPHHHHD